MNDEILGVVNTPELPDHIKNLIPVTSGICPRPRNYNDIDKIKEKSLYRLNEAKDKLSKTFSENSDFIDIAENEYNDINYHLEQCIKLINKI